MYTRPMHSPPGPYSVLSTDSSPGGHKRKRSWSRAVFSQLQRKGLEKRFDVQKYVTKPDRRKLAAMLGLTDAQVKVWFQNRRMKWRHAEKAEEVAANAVPVDKTPEITSTNGEMTSVADSASHVTEQRVDEMEEADADSDSDMSVTSPGECDQSDSLTRIT